jgi:hypothetical protein
LSWKNESPIPEQLHLNAIGSSKSGRKPAISKPLWKRHEEAKGHSIAGNLVLSNEDIKCKRNLIAIHTTPLGARDKPHNERLLNLDSEPQMGETTYR